MKKLLLLAVILLALTGCAVTATPESSATPALPPVTTQTTPSATPTPTSTKTPEIVEHVEVTPAAYRIPNAYGAHKLLQPGENIISTQLTVKDSLYLGGELYWLFLESFPQFTQTWGDFDEAVIDRINEH